jgi:gas vesicle structural protein
MVVMPSLLADNLKRVGFTAPYKKRNNSQEVPIMAVEKAIGSSSLVEVIDRILDKGVVVDAWVRVSLVGIEILAIEARVVVASVETYLKYAEAIGLTATAA